MGKKARAKNLTDGTIAQIAGVLDGWSGPLSWDLFLDAVELHTGARYTRQALFRHARIAQAFSLRKSALETSGKAKDVEAIAPELQAALARIARIEDENQRLRAENQLLLEQFAVWAYNAHMRGLDEDYLSQPLPHVNRDQTKLTGPQAAAKAQSARKPTRGQGA